MSDFGDGDALKMENHYDRVVEINSCQRSNPGYILLKNPQWGTEGCHQSLLDRVWLTHSGNGPRPFGSLVLPNEVIASLRRKSAERVYNHCNSNIEICDIFAVTIFRKRA
jgi:hypothetical protein